MHPAKALRFDCAFRKHIFELGLKPYVTLRAVSNAVNGPSDDLLVLVFVDPESSAQGSLYTNDKAATVFQARLSEPIIAIDVKVAGHFQRFVEQVERSNSLGQCRSALGTQGAKLRDVLSSFHERRARSIHAGSFERKNVRCLEESSYSDVVVKDFDRLQSSDQCFSFWSTQSGEYRFVDIILLVTPRAFAQAQPHGYAGRSRCPERRGPACRCWICNKTSDGGRQYRCDGQHDSDCANYDGPAAPVEPFPNRFVHRGFLPSWWVGASYSTQWRLSA